MSSSPKKPYKSKLLNLINRYYIKLNSNLGVKVRELSYNIQGSLQKLTLPFWQMWQSTTNRAKVGASNSDYSLPQADRNQTVIKTHQVDYLIRAVNHNLSKHPVYTSLLPNDFTGLASSLKQRDIVTVVNLNQVQNMDEKIDQDYLKFTIDYTLENSRASGLKNNLIGNYLAKIKAILPTFKQKQKQLNTSTIKNNLLPAEEQINSQNRFAFLREKKNNSLSSNQLTGSEILLAIEPDIEIQEQIDNSNSHQPQPQKLLSVPKKPRFSLPPIKNELVKEVVTISHEKIQKVLPVIRKNTGKLVIKSIDQIQLTTRNINKSIDEDPFQIKVLIIEALNYFFTQQKKQQNKQLNSVNNDRSLPKITQTKTTIIQEEVNQPWLSWSDLYGNQKSLPLENTDEITNKTIPVSTQKNITEITDKIVPVLITDDQVKSTEVNSQITTIKRQSQAIVKNHVSQVENKVVHSQTSSISTITKPISLTQIKKEKSQVIESNHNQELTNKVPVQVTKKTVSKIENKAPEQPEQQEAIEVKVIEIKYEKHLLEIVLEKLDRVILWLEETLVKVIAIIKILITNISEQ